MGRFYPPFRASNSSAAAGLGSEGRLPPAQSQQEDERCPHPSSLDLCLFQGLLQLLDPIAKCLLSIKRLGIISHDRKDPVHVPGANRQAVNQLLHWMIRRLERIKSGPALRGQLL